MRVLIAALFMFLAATASYGQTGPGRPEPGLFAGATKARLITRVIAPPESADSSRPCKVSKDEIERVARSVLGKSPLTLTEKGEDVTIIVDVEVYYKDLEEPIDICIGRVSVRSGVSTEVRLAYGNISTETWVDLFEIVDTVVGSAAYFAAEVSERVNGLTERFLVIWRKDQKS